MKKAVSFSALLVVALLCGLWTSRASAQAVFGSIGGTITDPQGAAVVGANVTVTDQNKGTTQATTTNESGNYSVTHLIPDSYSVKIKRRVSRARATLTFWFMPILLSVWICSCSWARPASPLRSRAWLRS